MSEIREADNDKLSAVEADAVCALASADITFPRHNEVPQVMNDSSVVYDDEDDK